MAFWYSFHSLLLIFYESGYGYCEVEQDDFCIAVLANVILCSCKFLKQPFGIALIDEWGKFCAEVLLFAGEVVQFGVVKIIDEVLSDLSRAILHKSAGLLALEGSNSLTPCLEFLEVAQTIGMILLVALMVLAFGNDIRSLF